MYVLSAAIIAQINHLFRNSLKNLKNKNYRQVSMINIGEMILHHKVLIGIPKISPGLQYK